jgi:hypothetical protein
MLGTFGLRDSQRTCVDILEKANQYLLFAQHLAALEKHEKSWIKVTHGTGVLIKDFEVLIFWLMGRGDILDVASPSRK